MIRQEEDSLVYCFGGELLTVVPWGADSIRVRSVLQGEIEDTDYALLEKKTGGKPRIIMSEGRGELINGRIRAVLETVPGKKTCVLSIYRSDGKLLLKEYGDGGALKLQSRRFQPIPGGEMELTVSFASSPDEKLFGMGQYQQEFLDWKGCVLELAQRNSQVSIPFVLSDRGYGFLWHNPSIGKVVFGKNKTEWSAFCTRQMDYWVTSGESPREILSAYAAVTGRSPIMPEYGLGFWQSRLRYWNQEQLLETAREYKRRGIALSVIVCDYFHWPKLGDFRFDREFFPDPEAMVKELNALDVELMVSVWPDIALDSENWEQMEEEGLLVKPEGGVRILKTFGGDSAYADVTNPRAREFVWEKCRENYYRYGIRSFWLDDAEPNYETLDFGHYRLSMGPNLQFGNLYPQLYAKAFYDGMKREGQEAVVNLVRCAWAGSQRYGTLIWSGDIHSTWEDLRRQVCAGISMGLSGIPWWTTDIGGFTGGDPAEEGFQKLLIRWFEWGTFCPVMRLHGDRLPSRPLYHQDGSSALFTGGDNEIWSFGEEAYLILKEFIGIRERLRPYLRMLMQEAHEEGAPVMRAMFYEFQEDAKCWSLRDQYMLGDALLAAPVLYEDTYERKVYLPSGEFWYDFFTGERYEGGSEPVIAAPLSRIPVLIRGSRREKLSL